MSDIVERLRDYASDDHERGCQGRCYDCSCGYDDRRNPLLIDAADEIERLRAATQWRPIDAMTRSERLLAKRPTTVGWFSIDGKWTVASAWYRRHGEDERLRWVTDGGHWCVPDYYLPEPPPPVKPERAPLPPPPAP